jgi:hypothetical protein
MLISKCKKCAKYLKDSIDYPDESFLKQTTIDENGLSVFVLPKNTKIYKGLDVKRGSSYIKNDHREQFSFFGDIQTAFTYAFKSSNLSKVIAKDFMIISATTTKELKFIDIMNKDNHKILKKHDGLHSDDFIKAFGFGEIRYSISDSDSNSAKLLCSFGYDGWAHGWLETTDHGKIIQIMQPELMICFPNKRITIVHESYRLFPFDKDYMYHITNENINRINILDKNGINNRVGDERKKIPKDGISEKNPTMNVIIKTYHTVLKKLYKGDYTEPVEKDSNQDSDSDSDSDGWVKPFDKYKEKMIELLNETKNDQNIAAISILTI